MIVDFFLVIVNGYVYIKLIILMLKEVVRMLRNANGGRDDHRWYLVLIHFIFKFCDFSNEYVTWRGEGVKGGHFQQLRGYS